jgi:phosphate transport system substrate-binding protein
VVPGIREYLEECTSEKTWGKEGYLIDHGLVPMSAEKRKKYRGIAQKLTPMPADF